MRGWVYVNERMGIRQWEDGYTSMRGWVYDKGVSKRLKSTIPSPPLREEGIGIKYKVFVTSLPVFYR